MSSFRQIEANRRNALKSTRPTIPFCRSGLFSPESSPDGQLILGLRGSPRCSPSSFSPPALGKITYNFR
jgi:hypothetical protein